MDLGERILQSLEREAGREVARGVEPGGRVAWLRSGEQLLLQIGGWQQRLRESRLRPGDRVGIDLPRGPDLIAAHLACLCAGACVVPINPSLSGPERAKLLARAGLSCLLGPGSGVEDASPRVSALDPERRALLIFTSGTTGEPKGVPHTAASLEANLAALADCWRLAPGERLLHVLPAHHVHGLVLALYGSARRGMPLVMLERFDADATLQTLERERVNVFMGVPTMYHRMLASPLQTDLREMRLFVCGSAPLSGADFVGFAARFGFEPVERYGLTETLIVTSNPVDGARRPGVVGFALPGTELRLAADGEVMVRGPSVMRGYLDDAAASAAAFDGAFFRTGDLGRLDADGALRIEGRKKELIIVGGSNVLPGEVEAALASDPGVEELAVAGLPDADRGEVVAAFFVPAGASSPADVERALRARAEATLSAYKRPRVYRALDELPRNAMGKLDRRALAGLA